MKAWDRVSLANERAFPVGFGSLVVQGGQLRLCLVLADAGCGRRWCRALKGERAREPPTLWVASLQAPAENEDEKPADCTRSKRKSVGNE